MTVCAGSPEFDWNGQTVSTDSDGIYTANLTSVAGCDSIATLTVTVTPEVTGSEEMTVCAGSPEFDWNGQTVSTDSDGIYTATLTSVAGCDSIATLTVTVTPEVTGSEEMTVCAGSPEFDWNGQTVSTDSDGIYTATLTSVAGCDSIATLTVTVTPEVAGSEEMTVCAGSPEFDWNGQTVSTDSDGIYTATLTSVAGCDSIATLTVTVTPEVSGSEEMTVCAGSPEFDWNGQTVSTDSDGIYTATLTSVAGCDSIATLTVTVTPEVTGSEEMTVCAGSPEFDWNGQTVSTDSDGIYTATLTSVAGCDSIATLTVTVTPEVAGSEEMTVCAGSPEFDWNGQTVSTDSDGIYTATLTSVAGCDSIATLTVTVTPEVAGSEEMTVCAGSPEFDWNGQTVSTDSDGIYTATLTSVAGCDSTVTLTVIIENNTFASVDSTVCENEIPFIWNGINITASGDYTANLKNSAGCDSTVTMTVNVINNIVASIDTIVCENEIPFIWSGQNITGAGVYSAALNSASGCDSTISLTVNVINNVVVSIDTTVCENQIPFDWNGQNLTAAGDYSVTFASVAGCDSTVILTVNVVNNIISTLDTTVCENELPFTWKGQDINAAGDYSILFNTASGCDSTVILTVKCHE